MVATHIKKINHSMLCVTGVYWRGITNTYSLILHLNVSHLSICSYCNFFMLLIVSIWIAQGRLYVLFFQFKTLLVLILEHMLFSCCYYCVWDGVFFFFFFNIEKPFWTFHPIVADWALAFTVLPFELHGS